MTDHKPPENNEQLATKQIGRYMTWITWLLALGLGTWFFQGKLEKQWNPNSAPLSQKDQQGRNTVVLKQNKYGHYVTQGFINNESVVFLLDTGATQVSIPQSVADKLQLSTFGQNRVSTANGSITVYATRLASVSIGSITLYDVAANINPHMQGDEILLGMSALKRVEFTQSGQQLILRD